MYLLEKEIYIYTYSRLNELKLASSTMSAMIGLTVDSINASVNVLKYQQQIRIENVKRFDITDTTGRLTTYKSTVQNMMRVS